MFFEKITNEGIEGYIEDAISKMKRFSSYDLEAVEYLEKLYKGNCFCVIRGEMDESIGFSPDYQEIKKVTLRISNRMDRKRAKGEIYRFVVIAYACVENLLKIKDKAPKSPARSPCLGCKIESEENPQIKYLTDGLLRDDGKCLEEFRKRYYDVYGQLLFDEEKKFSGFEPSKSPKLFQKKDILIYTAWISSVLATDIILLYSTKPHPAIPIGLNFAAWGVVYADIFRKCDKYKKWFKNNVLNIARSLPQERS